MNRKQRRAKETSPASIKSADDIPLARPDEYNGKVPEGRSKTLLEIAAERQAQLATGSGGGGRIAGKVDASAFKPENIVQVKIDKDGNLITPDGGSAATISSRSSTSGEEGSESETPWLDTLLLSITLSAVHFTLSVLAMHQYAESLRIAPLARQTLVTAFPTLTGLVALFHGLLLPRSLVAWFSAQKQKRLRDYVLLARGAVYVVTANVAGCYLIALTNDRGYYAVMKDAPGVGTIWVWAVLEMGLVGALAGVVGPAAYAWWYGYGIF